MAKYDGILICTDLDGTLSDKNGIISKENAEAIRYFKANGGKFTLSTGRSAPFFMGDNTVFARSGLEFLPNVPVVTHNGASVFDFEKMEYIYSVPLPGDEIEKTILKKACAEDEVEYVFISGENADSISIIRRCEHDDFEKAVLECHGDKNNKLYKLVFCVKTEEYAKHMRDKFREFFESYGRYSVNRTWKVGVEVLKDNATKGVAVNWLRNHIGGIKHVVCIGDFENDVTMIKEADLGIAVGNASEELKACADIITVTNAEHALAKTIYDLDKYINLDA